jgi:hypothetical protein
VLTLVFLHWSVDSSCSIQWKSYLESMSCEHVEQPSRKRRQRGNFAI